MPQRREGSRYLIQVERQRGVAYQCGRGAAAETAILARRVDRVKVDAGGQELSFGDIGRAEGLEDGGGCLGVGQVRARLLEEDVEGELGEAALGFRAEDCVGLRDISACYLTLLRKDVVPCRCLSPPASPPAHLSPLFLAPPEHPLPSTARHWSRRVHAGRHAPRIHV